MPLIVNYTKLQNWSAKSQKFEDPKDRQSADDVGHLLMTIGISELTEKTLNEVIIRKLILDRLLDMPYFKEDGKKPTADEYRTMFRKELGLFIEGRWARTETRWKFVARHAKGMMQDISYSVNN
tara:strand:+ start:83 stop:454 length:372 start_codon:yes stop_codon:yes gene_type:complete